MTASLETPRLNERRLLSTPVRCNGRVYSYAKAQRTLDEIRVTQPRLAANLERNGWAGDVILETESGKFAYGYATPTGHLLPVRHIPR